MDLAKTLFRPVFEPEAGGADERDDEAAIKTYRYLRLGMIAVVVALVVSIAFVVDVTHCWQGSISAYYYTSARPIFVSGMIAISVSLIVIKGSTVTEDLLLNFAGMMAPIVAFVPTSFERSCANPLEQEASGSADSIRQAAQNNLAATLAAGLFALVVGLVVFAVEKRRGKIGRRDVPGQVFVLGATALALLVASWLLATERILDYHGWSAVAMFGFLALAAIANGVWLLWVNRRPGPNTSRYWRTYAYLYLFVGVTMIAGGAFIKFGIRGEWAHRTLVLEMTEIALFVVMWAVQSVERWDKILQTPKVGADVAYEP